MSEYKYYDDDEKDEPEDEDDGFYYDICYECSGYGDDYFINEDGELESACATCPFAERGKEREE